MKKRYGSRIKYKFCMVCGESDYDQLTVDHIIPCDFGGSKTDANNLMFLCDKHNVEKDNLTPEEWFRIYGIRKRTIAHSQSLYSKLIETIRNATEFHYFQILNAPIITYHNVEEITL